ncbi:MAG: histidinol dehydrogenase [Asgard group archaeon]|nr:histidinol dehydrogenase [Asgard group archaeon]
MTKIYTVQEAKKTILQRQSILEMGATQKVKESIKKIFGKELTPYEVVNIIIEDVRTTGDQAVRKWTKKIDKVDISENIEIPTETLRVALNDLSKEVKQALIMARNRIREFHTKEPIESWITTKLGGRLGQLIRPIQKIGVYVPGGTAPLPSSLLMTAIPAILAGSEEIAITTPPQKDGTINPVILATCELLQKMTSNTNIRLFRVGGAQAIAALAFGTETISKVNKIFGPGNIFIALAKQAVFGYVGIDGIAGPTEAMILADKTASSELVAADLLAQAEHYVLAIPILITPDAKLAKQVQVEIQQQIHKLSRQEIIRKSLKKQGGIVLTKSMKEGVELINNFAPEHLSIITINPQEFVNDIKNAGGIFLGEISCEVIGDYVAGPSHVMPTGGSAKFASPLSVLDFVKRISLIELDNKTVGKISTAAEIIARKESLTAHAEAARRRKNG